MINISAAIITLNEAERIEACLSSISFCDEIVLVDSGSTDGTQDLARQFTDRIYHEEFKGDGRQKNIAISKTTGRWVFFIDGDEVVPPALAEEIVATVRKYDSLPSISKGSSTRPRHPVAWSVPRRNYVGGVWVKHGGWYPDHQTRLWIQGQARYKNDLAHPGVIADGPIRKLTTPLEHYTYDSSADYRQRMVRYADGRAWDYLAAGKRARPWSPLAHRIWTFFQAYLLRGGFRDGTLGWELAHLNATYSALKYKNMLSRQAKPGSL